MPFITFEGGEGAGKTTLIDKIEKELISNGYEVVKTREPGGSKLSEYIRQWLLNRDFNISVGKKAELLLFLAARAQHIEEQIKPALEDGKIVLCDRFNDSSVVYQGVARGLGVDLVQRLCELVCAELVPTLTLFLDVDPEVGLNRTKGIHKENAKAGEVDRIEGEKIEFHRLIQQGFRELAWQYPERIRTIDANQNPQAVFDHALSIIQAVLLE